jgi:DNA end-binding protein Ku
MQQLFYPNEIRSLDELDLGDAVIKDNELKMAVQLAEMGASDDFQPENYRDEVADRIRGMIQQKIDGEEITTNMVEQPKAQVIDLMEALKASLGDRKPKAAPAPASRVPIKTEAKRKPAKATARKPAATKRASR